MATAWMRFLKITLTSDILLKQIVIGGSGYNDNLTIDITGTKYLAAAKDEFTVTIKNIPNEASSDNVSAVAIKDGGYGYIKIDAGYEDLYMTIFDGYVVYVSSIKSDNNKTSSMILVCSGSYTYNNLKKLSFTLKKNTTLYSAITFAARKTGISKLDISKTLKHRRLSSNTSYDGSLSSLLIALGENDQKILCHCDKTSGSVLKVWDGTITSSRVIQLTSENIILSNGYPSITKDGIDFVVLPFFNFMPGDTVILDNSTFINASVDSLSAYSSNPEPEHYLDSEGKYFIKQLSYKLQNRGSEFSCTLHCYAKSLYDNITGTNKVES